AGRAVRTVGAAPGSPLQAPPGGRLGRNVSAFLARESVVSAERRGPYSRPHVGGDVRGGRRQRTRVVRERGSRSRPGQAADARHSTGRAPVAPLQSPGRG